MIVNYEKSFLRDLKRVEDQKVLDEVAEIINAFKETKSPMNLPQVKKMKGHPSAYRIKIKDYRLGFFYENNAVILTRLLRRKDIYRDFP